MRHLLLLFNCLLWFTNCMHAQLPKLIKNVGEGGSHGMNVGWTYPNVFANAEGRLLFWGTDEDNGRELWITNGTSEGTQLVKDLVPGPGSLAMVHTYYKQNDRGVYFASEDIGDREIWFSNGTPQNTIRLLKETEQYRFDYNIMSFNSSAVVYNNLFVLGYTTDAEGMKRCIYRLEPENENVDPATAIIWKDTLIMTQYHYGILEICEFQGQLVAVAQSATSEGLVTINRDFGYTTWMLKTTGAIYNLGNTNNHFLAFRYPGPDNPLACIKNVNSPSLEILLSPGYFASPVEDNQVVKSVTNKLFFYTDQYSKELWVTDGTSEGTRPAPFSGTTRLIGNKENAVVVFLTKEDGSVVLLTWDGGNNYQVLSEDQNTLLASTVSFLETQERQYIFSQDLFVIINGRSYRILGVPNQGDSTRMNFTYYFGYETKKLLGNNLILSGWNNTLVGVNAIGQEPYKFPVDIKLWTGVVSSDWHDDRNWHPEDVPSVTESILIPETPTSNYPVLNRDGSCKDLYANFGGVIVEANAALTIAGELSNYWALSGQGKIIMTGNYPALITGPGDYTFSQLELPSSEYQIKDESKTISSKITLGSNTKVFMNEVDLILNTAHIDPIENFSPNSYFVSNGIGSLGIYMGTNTNQGTQQILPVGRSSFNPVTITYEGSTPAMFSANVIDEAFEEGLQGNSISLSNIDRTWDIKKVGGDQTNANVLLQWQASDELPGFDRNKCFVRHHIEDQWKNGEVDAASILSNGMYAREMRDIASFSPFTVSSNLSALPLKLLTFTSKVSKDQCELKWTTDREINVSHFEVEHAMVPGRFSKVGIVKADQNNGPRNSYFFTHTLQQGRNYYRIKILDRDGTYTLSSVISAKSTVFKKVHLYPNPVTNQLTVTTPIDDPIKDLTIRNLAGQILYRKQLDVQSTFQIVDVSNFPKSVYQLQITYRTGKTIKNFVKQ